MHFSHNGVPDPEALTFRPSKFSYSLRALADLPARLRCPPPAPADARLPSYASPCFPLLTLKPRSQPALVTPTFRVHLADVIDAKHLPPLTTRDFEDYLLFVERNAQNLSAHLLSFAFVRSLTSPYIRYFILWLKQYSQRYSEWIADDLCLSNEHLPLPSSPSMHVYTSSSYLIPSRNLAYFFACAKETFFSHSSPLRLHVTNDALAPFMRTPFPFDASVGWADAHPPPQLFGPVKHEVERVLQESLDRFVRISYMNTGNWRRITGMMLGALVVLAGLVPLWLSLFAGRSREFRLIGIPLFLLGFLMFLSTKNGVRSFHQSQIPILFRFFRNFMKAHPFAAFFDRFVSSSTLSATHVNSIRGNFAGQRIDLPRHCRYRSLTILTPSLSPLRPFPSLRQFISVLIIPTWGAYTNLTRGRPRPRGEIPSRQTILRIPLSLPTTISTSSVSNSNSNDNSSMIRTARTTTSGSLFQSRFRTSSASICPLRL